MPRNTEKNIFYVKTYYETKSFKIVHAKYKRKFNFQTRIRFSTS